MKSQTFIQVLKPKVETTALDSITALSRYVSIQNNKCLHFPHISKVNFNLSYGVDSLYMWLLRTIKEIYRFFSKVCQRFFYSPFIHLCWHRTKETVTFTIILGLMVFAFMVKIQQILYYQLIVDTLKPKLDFTSLKSSLVKIIVQSLRRRIFPKIGLLWFHSIHY